jgi:hypothetical protein
MLMPLLFEPLRGFCAQHISWDAVINFCDLCAFALVTPDLYGRDRLRALSERLRAAPRPDLQLARFWERRFQLDPHRWRWATKRVGIINYTMATLSVYAMLIALVMGIFAGTYFGIRGGGVMDDAIPDGSASLEHHVVIGVLSAVFWFGIAMFAFLLLTPALIVLGFVYWAGKRIVGYVTEVVGSHVGVEGGMLVAGAGLYAMARLVGMIRGIH